MHQSLPHSLALHGGKDAQRAESQRRDDAVQTTSGATEVPDHFAVDDGHEAESREPVRPGPKLLDQPDLWWLLTGSTGIRIGEGLRMHGPDRRDV
jgi:hypothetical protein